MKELEFKIENTGGVTHADLKLNAGVNVLRGRNGAGKTSCIEAVVRASGGKVPLQRKDGADEGRVLGPGVTLTIKKVVKADGQAELELADTGPLGRLIDPGLKDSKASARERIRALVELLDLGVDDEKLLTLCNGDRVLFDALTQSVDDNAIDNLLEASEKLRHMVHARAREQEETAAVAQAEVEKSLEECRGILETIGGPSKLSALSADEAQKQVEAAVRTHDRAVGQAEAREALISKQDAIRETLGEKPDPSDAENGLKNRVRTHAALKDRVDELRAELQAAEIKLTGAEADVELAAERVEQRKKALDAWTTQRAILDKDPVGPTQAEVDTMFVETVERAREGLKSATLTETFNAREKAHDEAVLTQERAEEKADALRKLASEIPTKLGRILASAGAEGFTVLDGRLYVTAEGEAPRDFELRCSTGQRAKAALAVASHVYRGRVLALDGEVWGNLDPKNRAEFAEAARAHDLCVVTEEPAEGPLRLELEPRS